MKFYNSILNLPIYNFWKISETQDLRYLILNVNCFDLPEIKPDKTFIDAYNEIIKQLPSFNFEIQKAFYNLIISGIQCLDKPSDKNKQKCNDMFFKYIKILEKYYDVFIFGDAEFTKILPYYEVYKSKFQLTNNDDYLIFINQRVAEFSYMTLKTKSLKTWDLEDELLSFEIGLSIKIDMFIDSVSRYFKVKERYIKKLEQMKIKEKK